MPLLCLPMTARAKLVCRRRLSSLLSKPFICFERLSDIVRKKRSNKQRWRISGKPSFSLAWEANERINDGHAQREREAPRALQHVGPRSDHDEYGVLLGDKQQALYFSITTQLAKIVSPTAVAKLAIDSASLESLVINREIFIPNREIGRFSLFYKKSGDLPPNRETWKLW